MTVQSICKAFGNKQRVQILLCLHKPHTVTELLTQCSLSQSALSQHLRILRAARLVDSTRSGTSIVYRAAHSRVVRLARELLSLSQ